MFDFSEARLIGLAVHEVGSLMRSEPLELSEGPTPLDSSEVEEVLRHYFLSAFKQGQLYSFTAEEELENNLVFQAVCESFRDPSGLYEQSVTLAKLLYDCSGKAVMKSGPFYVAYFSDCMIDEIRTDAIGLFKTEHKDFFLKIERKNDRLVMCCEDGISLKKPDKGCLIFGLDAPDGFRIALLDRSKKKEDSLFWTEDYLQVKPREDKHFQTQACLELCKDFAENVYPALCEAEKTDQMMLVQESMNYFDEKEEFNLNDFAEQVFQHPDLIEQFKNYKQDFDENRGQNLPESFEIEPEAVKAMKRKVKRLIRLDTGVELHIKQTDSLPEVMEKGYDEKRGMAYYKVYFKEEE